VPSLFRRKSADTVEPPVEEAPISAAGARSRAYTPSKRDLGRATPKRKEAGQRRVEPPPTNRREAARRMREKQREARTESRRGMMEGKEEYLLGRDKGPERALARDIVDSRRTVGTWFFVGAFLVLFGSNRAMPAIVQFVANGLFIFLVLALAVDSFLIARRIRRLVNERFPKSTQRMGGLYFYAIMRAISFRRIRVPRPRVKIGQAI